MHRPLLAWLAPALLACLPFAAQAGQSYDNCTGFIDSLPANITTQGTWCLRRDLNTAMTAGEAITVAANNVTIDCNHFKIGGLAAGVASRTQGIYSGNRQNITVRNCVVRGFFTGIQMYGGGGHLIEDNRIDNTLYMAIAMSGEGGMIRNNLIKDTGGAPDQVSSVAISASADAIDNTIEGMFAVGTDTYVTAISIGLAGAEVRGNRVRGLVVNGAGRATGAYGAKMGITFADNRISSSVAIQGWGIAAGALSFCTGNTVSRYSTPIQNCQDAGGNASN
jgi:hypothetical protein